MTASFPGVSTRYGGLDGLEGAKVDGGVGEHASETSRKAAVEDTHTGLAPHLTRSGCNEGDAVLSAADGLGLDATGRIVSE